MSVYGMDLRRKVVAALGKGHSVAAVARRFDVDEKTVRSYRRRAAWDRLAPDRGGPNGHRKLTDDDLRTLEREVAKDPGVTLRQLRGKLSVPVAESTCAGRSRSWGCHLKKVADRRRAVAAGRTTSTTRLRDRVAVRAARAADLPR